MRGLLFFVGTVHEWLNIEIPVWSNKVFLDKTIGGCGAQCTHFVRVYAPRYPARRCRGEATVTCVLPSLKDADVVVSSDVSASATTTRIVMPFRVQGLYPTNSLPTRWRCAISTTRTSGCHCQRSRFLAKLEIRIIPLLKFAPTVAK
jgi:hypothetical protein